MLLMQFPALYEREAIQLVHHSLEAAEQLCSTILSHLASHYVEVGGAVEHQLCIAHKSLLGRCVAWKV
jgi:hypothetical protein